MFLEYPYKFLKLCKPLRYILPFELQFLVFMFFIRLRKSPIGKFISYCIIRGGKTEMPILNAGATPKQPTLTYRCFLIHTDE